MLDFSKRVNKSGKFRAKCLPTKQKIFDNRESHPPRFKKTRVYLSNNSGKFSVDYKSFPNLK